MEYKMLKDTINDEVNKCNDVDLLDLIWKMLISYKDESLLYPRYDTIKR